MNEWVCCDTLYKDCGLVIYQFSLWKKKAKGCLCLKISTFPFPFPFDKEDTEVIGGSCGGWLYFHSRKGQIALWNLTSRQSKVLPRPDFNPLDQGELIASGVGYDAKSGDYKVMRHYLQYHLKTYQDGPKLRDGFTDHFEVCSFNRPSWRDIRGPDTSTTIHSGTGVYVNVTGRCYWPAFYNIDHSESRLEVANSGASPYSQFVHVVSFDFATERFHQFPLPATTLGVEPTYKLVGCRGLLGTLVYDDTNSSSFGLSIQLHVWSLKTRSWKLLYNIPQLLDVTRPILGLKDDLFLFLESKPSCGCSQLMVYDLHNKTVEKLDIYDCPGYMNGFSYALTMDPPLPHSKEEEEQEGEEEEELATFTETSLVKARNRIEQWNRKKK